MLTLHLSVCLTFLCCPVDCKPHKSKESVLLAFIFPRSFLGIQFLGCLRKTFNDPHTEPTLKSPWRRSPLLEGKIQPNFRNASQKRGNVEETKQPTTTLGSRKSSVLETNRLVQAGSAPCRLSVAEQGRPFSSHLWVPPSTELRDPQHGKALSAILPTLFLVGPSLSQEPPLGVLGPFPQNTLLV